MQTPGSPRIATPEAQIGGKLAGWAKILDGCKAGRMFVRQQTGAIRRPKRPRRVLKLRLSLGF
jgi:hypothetical protein